jgi:hypothetical protein
MNMSLKYRIKSLDDVDEAVRDLYTKKGDEYVLAIEGIPDVGEYETRIEKMDAKIAELLDEKKLEKKKREKAELEAKKKAEDDARKSGDLEALEKSWKEKFEKRESELQAQIDERDGWINEATRETAAKDLANRLAIEGSADLLLPQLRDSIGVDIRDGRPVPVVLDENGKPSAMSLDELGTKIAERPANAPIIAASKAAGGGAKGGKGGGAAPGKDISAMTPADKAAFISEHGLDAWQQKVVAAGKDARAAESR